MEDSAGGPDFTVGILPKLDKVTLLQVLSDVLYFSFSFFVCVLSLGGILSFYF